MKVQSITKTNFTGLYTNKTAQNGGDWKMEYQPYSWERTKENKFGTGVQEEWDILASTLPDNEKHYIEKTYKEFDIYSYPILERKSCEDILGTEYYYEDIKTKIMRNSLVHKEAMNLEDSLTVLNKKLGIFLNLKKAEIKNTEENFDIEKGAMDTYSGQFDYYYNDYKKGTFSRDNYKSENLKGMYDNKNSLKRNVDDMYNNIKKYIALRDSSNNVAQQRRDIEKELAVIEKARESGKIIDISQRVYTYDPNKKLWEALHNIEAVKDSIVALPHRTISVRNILTELGVNVKSKDIPDKAIKFIDELIRKKI